MECARHIVFSGFCTPERRRGGESGCERRSGISDAGASPAAACFHAVCKNAETMVPNQNWQRKDRRRHAERFLLRPKCGERRWICKRCRQAAAAGKHGDPEEARSVLEAVHRCCSLALCRGNCFSKILFKDGSFRTLSRHFCETASTSHESSRSSERRIG